MALRDAAVRECQSLSRLQGHGGFAECIAKMRGCPVGFARLIGGFTKEELRRMGLTPLIFAALLFCFRDFGRAGGDRKALIFCYFLIKQKVERRRNHCNSIRGVSSYAKFDGQKKQELKSTLNKSYLARKSENVLLMRKTVFDFC
ncbi:hypothetical protein LJC68_03625 [Bacteroidales bacterium OttesenSCG-928-B11]|nr:hypothetical protein [Bacteroidales bacterium OttesenSCG-928-E04]MDL2308694.1 hypothetical protein [Bacteroidales bacterium OttesenSCG-928-C03]MDL2311951.1 hypothetical protein [Bacteroidales bacterium OttesenSCG-928-B11]